MSQLEKEVSVLDTRTKTIDKSVDELKESLCFCEDEISELKKNADDIKDNCSSNTDELRKQILYLETYSRRESLKFVGIPEKSTSNDTSLMPVKDQARTQRQLFTSLWQTSYRWRYHIRKLRINAFIVLANLTERAHVPFW